MKPLVPPYGVNMGVPLNPRLGAGEHDVTTGLLEVGYGELGHQERGARVHPQRVVELIQVELLDRREFDQHARDVGQDIDAAESLHARVDAGLRVNLIGDIAQIDRRASAMLNDRVRHILHGIIRQPAEQHGCTLARELERGRLTDARARARDDGNLVLQTHGSFL